MEEINTISNDYIRDASVELNSTNTTLNNGKKERILSIDRFRGICMFCLVISGFMGLFGDQLRVLEVLFSHDAAIGFNVFKGVTLADLFAPYFIFIMGMSAVISYKSKLKSLGSKSKAYAALYLRFTGILGLGWTISGVDIFVSNIDKFAACSTSEQFIIVTSLIAVVLLVLSAVGLPFKNKKIKGVLSLLFKFWIAFTGTACLIMAIIDVGIVIGATESATLAPWDVLQTIGAAGIIALPFLGSGKNARLIGASVITLVLALIINNGAFAAFNSILNGGMLGAFGWGAIMLFGSVACDLRKKPLQLWLFAAILIAIALTMTYGFDLIATKRGATAPYVLITAGSATAIWGLLNLFNNFKPKFAFFTWWGGSALLTYITFLLLSYVMEIAIPFDKLPATGWGLAVAIIVPLILTALFSLANALLYKKQKFIKL